MKDPVGDLHAVGRSASTDDDLAFSTPRGFQVPPGRLRGGGRRRPAFVALAIAAVLALLAWQPWTPDEHAIVPPGRPSPAIARADGSGAPTPAAGLPTVGSAFYVSITDNEWTVVALLTPDAPTSSEEPATQHSAGAAWSPAGPFLVLQQGLTPVGTPVERAGHPGEPCIPAGVPRDRTAAPLPAGRVAYLGITIPGRTSCRGW